MPIPLGTNFELFYRVMLSLKDFKLMCSGETVIVYKVVIGRLF